jgi:hypothetical protein
MQALGKDSFKLLEKLIHFDPSRRCSLHEAILCSVFDPLRSRDTRSHHQQSSRNVLTLSQEDEQASDLSMTISIDEHQHLNIVDRVSYMHYYRNDRCGADSLPML